MKSAQITEVAEAANLSKRETEVFDFIARGYNSTYIACFRYAKSEHIAE